jgi:hypothetical protein
MQQDESHLLELRSFIRDVVATRTEEMDSEVVAVVRRAIRVQPDFPVRVVVRALQLEQKLRSAQQELIRLQWEIARLRQGSTSRLPAAGEDED